MKKLTVVTILVLLTGMVSNAQHKWAAGYQLAIGNSNHPLSYLTSTQDVDMKPMFTNQLFLKRKITTKLDLQLDFGFTSWKQTYANTIYTNPITIEEYNLKNIAFNLTLTGKMNILQKPKSSLYIPFGINNVYHQWRANYNEELLKYPWMTEKEEKIQIAQNIFTGIGINYDLNQKLYLNGQGTIGYKLYNALQAMNKAQNETNNFSYSLQAGIGYRF